MDQEKQERDSWNGLRSKLKNSYTYSREWEQATSLFSMRLERKYLNPIDSIIDQHWFEGEGFTIVTVQCALIEALASFRAGKIYNLRWTAASPKFEYSKSKKMFVEFLHTAKIFKDNFWELDKYGNQINDQPFSAEEFYEHVRCGLMHEARTKGNWHINASAHDVLNQRVFIETDGQKIRVQRTVLHHRLKDYITEYCFDLRSQDVPANDLRRNFARKLDHLFDITPDPNNFEWWVDI